MDIYAYRGAWYCPDCASSIMKGLGRHADSGDSNDYPQCVGPAEKLETDCPEHCSGCEEFLKTALTEAGRQYVKEQLLIHVFGGQGRKEILQQWVDYYNMDWPDPEDTEGAMEFGTQCANEALAMMGYPEDEESLPEGPQPGDCEALQSELVGRGPTYEEGRAFEEGFKSVINDYLKDICQLKECSGVDYETKIRDVSIVYLSDLTEGIDGLPEEWTDSAPWSFGDADHTLVEIREFARYTLPFVTPLRGPLYLELQRRVSQIPDGTFVDLEN